MAISVITPHYNDPDGLKQIYRCLLEQVDALWEWIIVDDFSDMDFQKKIQDWYLDIEDPRVKLICNEKKSNASICRNRGADNAIYENLVFLDADDTIGPHFLVNRQIEFFDFCVLKNTATVDREKQIRFSQKITGNYLNYFLKAQFIWPITAILWKKNYFNKIGQFNPQLPRLQDVELAIRALQNSENYSVLDNEVDFFYNVKPIRSRKKFLKPVCNATYILIDQLLSTRNLTSYQLSLIGGYYFMCTKYLERSESRKGIPWVSKNLKLFYKKRYVSLPQFLFGTVSLKLYCWHIFSGKLFLRLNRYVFKPRN